MFWKLLPQVMTTLLMVVMALLDYKWYDKRTRRFQRGRKAVFGLLAILMIVSIVAIWRDRETDKIEKAALQGEIEDLKGMQFGGDSYCYVFPTRPNKESRSIGLMLLHEGEYPVFDVSVRIEDINRLVEIIRTSRWGVQPRPGNNDIPWA